MLVETGGHRDTVSKKGEREEREGVSGKGVCWSIVGSEEKREKCLCLCLWWEEVELCECECDCERACVCG